MDNPLPPQPLSGMENNTHHPPSSYATATPSSQYLECAANTTALSQNYPQHPQELPYPPTNPFASNHSTPTHPTQHPQYQAQRQHQHHHQAQLFNQSQYVGGMTSSSGVPVTGAGYNASGRQYAVDGSGVGTGPQSGMPAGMYPNRYDTSPPRPIEPLRQSSYASQPYHPHSSSPYQPSNPPNPTSNPRTYPLPSTSTAPPGAQHPTQGLSSQGYDEMYGARARVVGSGSYGMGMENRGNPAGFGGSLGRGMYFAVSDAGAGGFDGSVGGVDGVGAYRTDNSMQSGYNNATPPNHGYPDLSAYNAGSSAQHHSVHPINTFSHQAHSLQYPQTQSHPPQPPTQTPSPSSRIQSNGHASRSANDEMMQSLNSQGDVMNMAFGVINPRARTTFARTEPVNLAVQNGSIARAGSGSGSAAGPSRINPGNRNGSSSGSGSSRKTATAKPYARPPTSAYPKSATYSTPGLGARSGSLAREQEMDFLLPGQMPMDGVLRGSGVGQGAENSILEGMGPLKPNMGSVIDGNTSYAPALMANTSNSFQSYPHTTDNPSSHSIHHNPHGSDYFARVIENGRQTERESGGEGAVDMEVEALHHGAADIDADATPKAPSQPLPAAKYAGTRRLDIPQNEIVYRRGIPYRELDEWETQSQADQREMQELMDGSYHSSKDSDGWTIEGYREAHPRQMVGGSAGGYDDPGSGSQAKYSHSRGDGFQEDNGMSPKANAGNAYYGYSPALSPEEDFDSDSEDDDGDDTSGSGSGSATATDIKSETSSHGTYQQQPPPQSQSQTHPQRLPNAHNRTRRAIDAPAPPRPVLRVTSKIGDESVTSAFELIRALGRGSFGDVQLCRFLSGALGVPQYVAIKLLPKTEYDREVRIIRLLLEIEARIQAHLPIVRPILWGQWRGVIDLDGREHERKYAIVMEWLPCVKQDLLRWQKTLDRTDENSILQAMLRSAEIHYGGYQALGQLHQHGIIYRDFKPGNLYQRGDIYVLGDYGSMDITPSGISYDPFGTMRYLSPAGSCLYWYNRYNQRRRRIGPEATQELEAYISVNLPEGGMTVQSDVYSVGVSVLEWTFKTTGRPKSINRYIDHRMIDDMAGLFRNDRTPTLEALKASLDQGYKQHGEIVSTKKYEAELSLLPASNLAIGILRALFAPVGRYAQITQLTPYNPLDVHREFRTLIQALKDGIVKASHSPDPYYARFFDEASLDPVPRKVAQAEHNTYGDSPGSHTPSSSGSSNDPSGSNTSSSQSSPYSTLGDSADYSNGEGLLPTLNLDAAGRTFESILLGGDDGADGSFWKTVYDARTKITKVVCVGQVTYEGSTTIITFCRFKGIRAMPSKYKLWYEIPVEGEVKLVEGASRSRKWVENVLMDTKVRYQNIEYV